MFALHLCFDGNFISNCANTFESFYPNQNLFLVNKDRFKLRMLQEKTNIVALPFIESNYEQIWKIVEEKKVDRIVLHGLSRSYLLLLRFLFERKSFRVYWIFWGYELYISLNQLGKYDLVDGKLNPFSLWAYMCPTKYNLVLRKLLGKNIISQVLLDIINYVDYFCFWNYKDFELLQENFPSKVKYKFFAYSAYSQKDETINVKTIDFHLKQKQNSAIMLNHQASITGNHRTIMDKIAKIDEDNQYKKICPLSYGSSYLRRYVLKKGSKMFGENFIPILNYMPKDEYFDIINKVSVAIFGARRQEASGNILYLLRNGVKVFLRNDNNLLQYYKEKGYHIFSFEDELNSFEDLTPLTLEQQRQNYYCSLENRIYYEQFMPTFFY